MFFKNCRCAPIGSSQFLGSKEESMACALRRYGVTDSGSLDAECNSLISICFSKIAGGTHRFTPIVGK
ncbi:MAG: hypothetical protein P8X74_06680 [Reinekea sp.]